MEINPEDLPAITKRFISYLCGNSAEYEKYQSKIAFKIKFRYDNPRLVDNLMLVVSAGLTPYEYLEIGVIIAWVARDYRNGDAELLGEPAGTLVVFIDPLPELFEDSPW